MNKYLFSLFLTALMLVNAEPSYAAAASQLTEFAYQSVASVDPALLEYRLAKGEADIAAILELYENFTEDDKHCLLVYPAGRLRRKMLAQSILADRIFVACDPDKEGNKIVSFCKLYMAEGQDLLDTINNEFSAGVFEESASGIPVFTPCLPAFARDYSLDLASINDFAHPLIEPSPIPYPSSAGSSLFGQFITQFVDPNIALKLDVSRDIFIYSGSAYTLEEYKGNGINSTLVRFALSTVSSSPRFRAKLQAGAFIHYMYGIVKKNFWGSAHLRSFTDFYCNFFGQSSVEASVTMHHTKKPEFETRGSRAVIAKSPQVKMLLSGECRSPEGLECSTPPIVFSDEKYFLPGYGCFVSCRIP